MLYERLDFTFNVTSFSSNFFIAFEIKPSIKYYEAYSYSLFAFSCFKENAVCPKYDLWTLEKK